MTVHIYKCDFCEKEVEIKDELKVARVVFLADGMEVREGYFSCPNCGQNNLVGNTTYTAEYIKSVESSSEEKEKVAEDAEAEADASEVDAHWEPPV